MIDEFTGKGGLLDQPEFSDDLGSIQFRKQRDVGDVINTTFRFVRDNLREIAIGMLYIVGPAALLAAVLSFFVQSNMQATMFDFSNMSNNPFDVYASIFTPAYFAYIGLLMVVQILVSAVVLGYVKLYREGLAGEITPARLWNVAGRQVWPILALSLIVGGIVILSMVIWIIPCLGALAWIAALIYLFPALSMAVVSRVLDEDSAMNAIRRPYELVKGQWGMAFATMAIAVIAFMAIAMLLSIPSTIIGFGSAMGTLTGENPGSTSRVLMAIGSVLSTFTYLCYTIPLVAGSLLYFNLAERKEGVALFADIDLIDAVPSEPEGPDDLELRSPTPSKPDKNPPQDDGFGGGGFRGGGFEKGPGA